MNGRAESSMIVIIAFLESVADVCEFTTVTDNVLVLCDKSSSKFI